MAIYDVNYGETNIERVEAESEGEAIDKLLNLLQTELEAVEVD